MELRREEGRKFKSFGFGLKGAKRLLSYKGNIISSSVGLNTSLKLQRQAIDTVPTKCNCLAMNHTLTACRVIAHQAYLKPHRAMRNRANT